MALAWAIAAAGGFGRQVERDLPDLIGDGEELW
jgi:hypothetical protein